MHTECLVRDGHQRAASCKLFTPEKRSVMQVAEVTISGGCGPVEAPGIQVLYTLSTHHHLVII